MTLDCQLAPMDGMSNSAFRSVCFQYGADGACTEMVAAISYARARRKRMPLMEALLNRRPEETLLAAQIIGNQPDIMAEAARRIEGLGRFDALEINMGCPARTVVSSGNGAAIMKDVHLAERIIRAVCEAVEMPIRVKMRLGWDEKHITAPEIAQIAQDAGCVAVTLHGRTRSQMYCGEVMLDEMRRVREGLHIPLYANGAVETAADALRFAKAVGTGKLCIGRAALKQPWIFEDIKRLERDEPALVRDAAERIRLLLTLADRLVLLKPERFAMREMRKFCTWYLSELYGSSDVLALLYRLEEKNAFEDALLKYLEDLRREGRMLPLSDAPQSLDTNDCYVHKEKKDSQ